MGEIKCFSTLNPYGSIPPHSNSETLLMIAHLDIKQSDILDPFYLSSVTSVCAGPSAQPVTLPWLST